MEASKLILLIFTCILVTAGETEAKVHRGNITTEKVRLKMMELIKLNASRKKNEVWKFERTFSNAICLRLMKYCDELQ